MDFLGSLQNKTFLYRWGNVQGSFFFKYILLPPVATPSEQHCNPDEDVDGVHVDADRGVHWVKGRRTIVGRMVLCLVDNFLGVVQQEGAEQDKATIHGNAVHSCAKSSGGWKEV